MKYIKGLGNLSFGSVKGPKRASTDEYYGFRKSRTRSFFANDYHLKFGTFTAVKRDTKFQTRYVKRQPFVSRRYTEGVPFS